MQLSANAMPDKFGDDREPRRFRVLLHGMRYVRNAIADDCFFNALVQCLVRHLQEIPDVLRNPSYRHCDGRITIVTFDHDSQIEADDIALFQHSA